MKIDITDEMVEAAARAAWAGRTDWDERTDSIWNAMSEGARDYARKAGRAALEAACAVHQNREGD